MKNTKSITLQKKENTEKAKRAADFVEEKEHT